MCLCLQVPMNPIAHQVLLFVCQSEFAYLCATVGIFGPPAIAVIPITVFCVKGKQSVCTCVCVLQHAVSHH